MLKLKYLFERFDLAEKAIKFYDHTDTRLFKYFRISANAIYPYNMNDDIRYLRMTPFSETTKEKLVNELNLLKFLELKAYPSVRLVETKEHKMYDLLEDDESYYITAFEGVGGEQLDTLDMTAVHACEIGKSLANFHQVTEAYEGKLPSITDQFDWMKREMIKLNQNTEEILTLEKYYERIKDISLMGCVHYDFEPDNLFYKTIITPIDFNDAMIHFYACDVVTVLSEIPKCFHESFLEGYRSIKAYVKNEDIEEFCLAYKSLFQKVRIKRVLSEQVINPPEWMVNLINKLERY